METKNTKTSGYFYQNEPVLVSITGFIAGFATILEEVMVNDGYGRNVKNYVVRFLGEEDTRTVNDLSVFCHPFMEGLRNRFAEIEKQTGLLRKTIEKCLNCKQLYDDYKGLLPAFIKEGHLRSHFESQCSMLAESIGKNLQAVEQMWENREKEFFLDMEMPGEILSLKEGFARIKEELARLVVEEEEAPEALAEEMSEPSLVLVPVVREDEVAADGSGPFPFFMPEAIPATVAAAS